MTHAKRPRRCGAPHLSLLLMLAGTALPAAAAPPQAATVAPSGAATAAQRDPEALQALDRMGAALRALKQFSLTSEGSTEVVLEDGQKIELDGVLSYKVRAPDKLFLELRSDRRLRQLFYDGKELTVYAPSLKYYARVDGVGGSLAELVDDASGRYGIDMPLADLFRWGTDKAPKSAILSAIHVGGGSIGGEPVEQYAFRQEGVDWQLWISKATSLPKQLSITSLDDPALPQYRARLQWDTRSEVPATAFQFTPPADAARIKLVPVAVVVAEDAEEN